MAKNIHDFSCFPKVLVTRMSVEVIVRIVSVCWFVYNLFMGYITGFSEKNSDPKYQQDILVDLVKYQAPWSHLLWGDPGNPGIT